jgi:uncharacterized protein
MKTLSISPYHLFQVHGDRFVYDLESGIAIQLDPPAYDALALRQDGAADEAITSHLRQRYGAETARSVFAELRGLASRGLFCGPVTIRDEAETEALIQELCQSAVGNITLSISEACNLRCRYCYIGTNGALENGFMSEEVARQAVDYAFSRVKPGESVSMCLFGGEPLLNKRVFRAILSYGAETAAAQGKKIHYSVTTNATLLDDELLADVKQYGVGVMVSIDGPREVQDQNRPCANGRGSFDLTMAGVRKLQDLGRRVNARCTLSNQCLDRPSIVQGLEDLGFGHIAVTPSWGKSYSRWPYDIGPEESAVLDAQDDALIARLFEQLKAGEPVRYDPFAKAVQAIHSRTVPRAPCGVGRGSLTAGIDGKLYPCHRYVGMEHYVIGDIWRGVDQEALANYYRAYYGARQKCENCWGVRICKRICPWYVSHEDGMAVPPPDWYCAAILRWYELGMWVYNRLKTEHPAYLAQLVGQNRGKQSLRGSKPSSDRSLKAASRPGIGRAAQAGAPTGIRRAAQTGAQRGA